MTFANVRRTPAPMRGAAVRAGGFISGVIMLLIAAFVLGIGGSSQARAGVDPMARGLAASALRPGSTTDCASVASLCLNLQSPSGTTTFSVDKVGTTNIGAIGAGNQVTTATPALKVQRRYNGSSTVFNLADFNFENQSSASTSAAIRVLQSGTCLGSWGYWGYPFVVGACNSSAGNDPAIMIQRGVGNSAGPVTSGDAHGFVDLSSINRTGTMAYNSYDARVNFNDNVSSTSYTHYVAFQSRPTLQMSGTIGVNPTNPLSALYSTFSTNSGGFGNPTLSFVAEVALEGWSSPGTGSMTDYQPIYIGNNNPGTGKNYAIQSLFPYPATYAGPMALCLAQTGSVGNPNSVCTTSVNYISPTAPTVTSGLGTSPSVQANGTAAGKITVGSTGTPTVTTVLAMPTNPNGWVCHLMDETAGTTAIQTADTTTSVTETWGAAPSNSDKIVYLCHGY